MEREGQLGWGLKLNFGQDPKRMVEIGSWVSDGGVWSLNLFNGVGCELLTFGLGSNSPTSFKIF